MQGSRQFIAALDSLDELMAWSRDILFRYGNPKKMSRFEIALEEAYVNVMNHAYKNSTPGVLVVDFQLDSDLLSFVVKDQGEEFNPIDNPKPFDKDAPLEDREIGGLGIHLILKMTDSATYERSNGWNILTLTQFLSE
jgi:anti-sigma regulatory factor (Ser/Thr protein kinase)